MLLHIIVVLIAIIFVVIVYLIKLPTIYFNIEVKQRCYCSDKCRNANQI